MSSCAPGDSKLKSKAAAFRSLVISSLAPSPPFSPMGLSKRELSRVLECWLLWCWTQADCRKRGAPDYCSLPKVGLLFVWESLINQQQHQQRGREREREPACSHRASVRETVSNLRCLGGNERKERASFSVARSHLDRMFSIPPCLFFWSSQHPLQWGTLATSLPLHMLVL